MDPAYCGECYGAPAPATASKAGCCNTCAEVRDAYASVSWSFGRGDHVAQCEREHYAEHLDSQRREGCRIEGGIRVNKVVGNFHFAPGKSFSNGQTHVHDLENFFVSSEPHTFTHTVHSLRFGPQIDKSVLERFIGRGAAAATAAGAGVLGAAQAMLSPLDGSSQATEERAYNYMYFVKVVSTAYLPLGWEKLNRGSSSSNLWGALEDTPHELIELGRYGAGPQGSIETHQYSVTSHKRNLGGGSDSADGHAERLHARGGIPGVFFVSLLHPLDLLQAWRANNERIVIRHLSNESHQPRKAIEDILGFLGWSMRRHWRDVDGCCCCRPRSLRGESEDEEAARWLRVVLNRSRRVCYDMGVASAWHCTVFDVVRSKYIFE